MCKAIDTTISDFGIKQRARQYALWNNWSQIVGKAIAKNASPYRWNGNVLVIKVVHPSWMQELSYLKKDLITRIKTAIPYIKINDIRLETGTVEKTDLEFKTTKIELVKDLSEEEKEFIEQVANELKDAKTKKAAIRLITKDFRLKKTIKMKS